MTSPAPLNRHEEAAVERSLRNAKALGVMASWLLHPEWAPRCTSGADYIDAARRAADDLDGWYERHEEEGRHANL